MNPPCASTTLPRREVACAKADEAASANRNENAKTRERRFKTSLHTEKQRAAVDGRRERALRGTRVRRGTRTPRRGGRRLERGASCGRTEQSRCPLRRATVLNGIARIQWLFRAPERR